MYEMATFRPVGRIEMSVSALAMMYLLMDDSELGSFHEKPLHLVEQAFHGSMTGIC